MTHIGRRTRPPHHVQDRGPFPPPGGGAGSGRLLFPRHNKAFLPPLPPAVVGVACVSRLAAASGGWCDRRRPVGGGLGRRIVPRTGECGHRE